MISFTVKLRFAADDRNRVNELLRLLAEASRKEKGCVTYIPHQVDGDPDTILIYEQYADDVALEAHRNSPHFQQWAVGGLYQLMKDRQMENLNAIL